MLPSSSSSVVSGRPVDQQGGAGAERDEREEDADPAGQQRQAGVDGAADGAELLPPQGEGQQDAERDQADGPQVAGLAAPERRARRLRAPGARRRLLGRLPGGLARGGARRGAPLGSSSPQCRRDYWLTWCFLWTLDPLNYEHMFAIVALHGTSLGAGRAGGGRHALRRRAGGRTARGQGRLRRDGVPPCERPHHHQHGAGGEPDALPAHDQPLPRLQPRLRLLLRPADARLPGPRDRDRLRAQNRGQGQRGRAVAGRAALARPGTATTSPWGPTPIPTNTPRASTT